MNDGNDSQTPRAARQTLESLAQAGITHLPRAKRRAPAATVPPTLGEPVRAAPVAAAVSVPLRAGAAAADRSGVPPTRSSLSAPLAASDLAGPISECSDLAPRERLAALDVVRLEVAGCQRCPELASTRTQTVFGVGNPQPRLVFMGEAPGADEDRQGEPFVGRAGQLLNRIIEACTMRREDVYILNTIKCRPPENRNPLPTESANCRGFLDRQLSVLRPEFICCLGAVASQNLLATEQTIGRLRGKFHDYRGIRVLCTYHPAYLLRNPAAKKDCWDDMQILLRAMGIALPGA